MMTASIRCLLAELYRDEEGAQLLEYILLTVLIGMAGIAGMSFLGHAAQDRSNNVAVIVQTLPG